MKAAVNEIHIPLTEDTAKAMYEVQYTFVQGNGYDTCSVWRSYQVFADEHTANAIAKMIKDGDIVPPCR